MSSRISGLGLNGIQSRLMGLHKTAYLDNLSYLPVGGFFGSAKQVSDMLLMVR